MTTPAPEISIIVSNWNGRAFIEPCLTTLWASGEASGHAFELIVVDDVSSDGSPEWIREHCPQARLLVNPVNVGFARTNNRGAREARGRILVMMNNDMKVPRNFIERLVAPFFADPETLPGSGPLFAVGAQTVQWDDGTPNHLCMDAAWRRGGLGQQWSDPQELTATAYAQGGGGAFDRERFLELGGFDPLFLCPSYWEDYDLCYRAGKLGWRVLYAPRAVADHLGRATTVRQHAPRRVEQVVENNRLWFCWLNLDDPRLWLRHLAALPWIYARDLATGRGLNGLLGCGRAILGLRRVWRRRAERRRSDPPRRRTDRDMMGLRPPS